MFIITFWLIFIITFAITITIVYLVNHLNHTNIANKQESINNNILKKLSALDFKITKVIYLNDLHAHDQADNYKKQIIIDQADKKICLIDYENDNLYILDFKEILNYEVYENGSTCTIGGGISGWFSGIFGAESEEKCKELKLLIRLNRYDVTQITYDIISNTTFNSGIKKSSQIYKNCILTLQEIISFLEVIKAENSNQKNEK